MSDRNLLLAPSKGHRRRRAAGNRGKVHSWPVFRGDEWLGDVVIFEAPAPTDLPPYGHMFEGITSSGQTTGAFLQRSDAAVAIAAQAVLR